MVVGIKDAAKLIGISVIACCAVLVCTMFLNFNIDLIEIEENITSPQAMIFYEAQCSTAKVVSSVSGGCLLITSVVMLLFYIKHYIDTRKKELGILKALGYSRIKIAKNFWVFGISTFVGASVGFGGAFLIMPAFYRLQNADKILPEISINFHIEILFYFVILPTIVFAALAVFYAWHKLKTPPLSLLKDNFQPAKTKKRKADKESSRSFIDDLKSSTLKSKKSLVFFIIFASFCFSAMTQMSLGILDLTSEMMSVMMLIIGLTLASTTLILAITTVISGNTKTIAMMRVFGYSQTECSKSLLSSYRPLAYIGFAIGTGYQYFLIRIMVDIVFKDLEEIPEKSFDFPVMLASLAAFIVIYEIVMHIFSKRINRISVKEVMLE